MRNVDADRVVAAQLTGIAAGVAQVRRCDHAGGFVEVAACLAAANARPGSTRARALLTMAAQMYVKSKGEGPQWWYPAAAAFLGEAGADLDAAAMGRSA